MSGEPDGFEAALLAAARDGQMELVRDLLDRGASPDIQDSDGRTSLTWAISCRHHTMATLLIDRGASVSDQDRTMIAEWTLWLAAQAENAYDKMYDARNATAAAGCYSDAKEFLQDALGLARRLERSDLMTEFAARLQHIKSVFRSQFSS